MKDFKSDSTAALQRFARDKRKRTVISERVERRSDSRREAGDTPALRENKSRRASFNPHFTADNRPVEERRRLGGTYRKSDDRDRDRGTVSRNRRDAGHPGAPEFGTGIRESGSDGAKKRMPGRKYTADRDNRVEKTSYKGRKSGSGAFGSRDVRSSRGSKKGRTGSVPRKDAPKSYPKYDPNKQTGEMRLNRFIAQSGLCSRREADDFIQAGLVSVNGTIVTELGTKVRPTDEVKFNDSKVEGEKKVYLVLNKPKGYVTSLEDPHADKTVMELVKGACTERIYPVGRLDKSSVGLLLFTNDGDLTRQLTHPSHLKKKVYQVLLDKPLTRADMDRIAAGITLEDGEIFADEIAYVSEAKDEVGIEIHSGRNRIVRRIFEHLGYTVKKLDRVYYAGLTKKNLKRGAWRFLTRDEVDRLKSGRYE